MIIIKGRARSDGGQLASYLVTKGDIGSVSVLEMRGLSGRDLRAGLRLAETEAELSQGKKPLWHAQINPAEGVQLTREQQLMAVDALERRLKFQGLPRVVVAHEKDGREHLHVVWSRFDRETGTLRRDDFSKRKNVAAAAEIAERLGLEPNRNPFENEQEQRQALTRDERRQRSHDADTHAEQQQEKRATLTRKERRAEITALWRATDSGQALRASLDDAGYTLARGYRGFVVVDANGQTHSLARQIDSARAKDVRSRLADLDQGSILAAKEIRAAMRQARADRARELAQAGAGTPAPAASSGTETGQDQPKTAKHGGSNGAGTSPEATQRPSNEAENRAADPISSKTAPGAAADEAQGPKTAADVLADLTRNHSTFTRQDLARLIDKETGGGGHQPWMVQAGGFDALSDDAKASAERSYATWAENNPDNAGRFGIARYVAYVQDQQAARDAANPEAVKARQDSKAAFDALMAEVDASSDLIRLGPDHTGRDRFTTRDMLETELRMQTDAGSLATRNGHGVSETIRNAVPGLDGLGTEQRAALDHVTDAGDLALVVGFAGTGKSRMLGLAREAWEAQGYRVRGAALSGIAAESLQNDAGIQARTLHSLLHQLGTVEERETALAQVDSQLDALRLEDGPLKGHRRGNQREISYLATKRGNMAEDLAAVRLTDRDVIVIDEAGMVGSRQMQRLLSEAQAAGAKVVLVGDQEQLQAVDAGAAFRSIRDAHGAQEITEVRRQAGTDREWMRDATREFGRASTADALGRYHAAGMTHQAETRDGAKAALVAAWTAARDEKPQGTQIILAYTRKDVAELNDLARASYRTEGKLGEDMTLKTAHGEKEFASGDRLYFTKNDTRLAVKNGSLGSVEKIDGGRVTVALDGGRSVQFDVKDYDHIAHGYAATVHKSQGVTVDRAHVLASRYMDRHAAYVGMTRHREQADLYFGADEFKSFESLSRRMSRDGSKDTTLDYLARAPEGQASDSLRAAVGDFYRRERPEAARPSWTDQPRPTPADTRQEPQRPMSLADRMAAAQATENNLAKPQTNPDRFDRWRMSDAQLAALDAETRRQAAEELRQKLGQKQTLGGPRL